MWTQTFDIENNCFDQPCITQFMGMLKVSLKCGSPGWAFLVWEVQRAKPSLIQAPQTPLMSDKGWVPATGSTDRVSFLPHRNHSHRNCGNHPSVQGGSTLKQCNYQRIISRGISRKHNGTKLVSLKKQIETTEDQTSLEKCYLELFKWRLKN